MADNEPEPLEEEDSDYTGLTVYDIKTMPNDWNIKSLVEFIEQGEIVIPPFQRNFVWDKKKASSLIESIIMGLPIPQLFLFEQGEQQLLIDGQQRLSSIYFFYKQRFPRKGQYVTIRFKSLQAGHKFIDPNLLENNTYFEDFRLQFPKVANEKPTNELHGKKYSELSDQQQRKLNLRTLRTISIIQYDPDPENTASSMYEIFYRLNTGGINLKPQEIRKSIFHCSFYQLLDELNGKPQWQKLLGQENPDKNSKDVEHLLRCFALAYSEEYKPPMARFLNTFSLQATKFSEKQLKECRAMFVQFMNSFSEPIENYDFKSSVGKFMVTILDALFTAWVQLYRKEQKQVKITVDKFVDMKQCIQSSLQKTNKPTTDKKLVQERVEIAKAILLRQ